VLKCTTFFRLGNQGWSETWFRDGSALASGQAALVALISVRKGILVQTGSIIGYRTSVVENPAIVSHQNDTDIPGTYNALRDITNASLLWEAVTNAFTRRQVWTRGMPDVVLTSGRYDPSSLFAVAVNNWANELTGNGWCIRTQNRADWPLRNVAGIDATGKLTMFVDPLFTVGMRLKFFRTRDTLGKTVKGTYAIVSGDFATGYQLSPWTPGRLVVEGKVRNYVLRPEQVVQIQIAKAGSRKTGRIFGVPAGRRRAAK